MRAPFHLFCSRGLGTSHSSLDHVTLTTARSLNSSGTEVFVNAATGNVVVTDTTFSLDVAQTTLSLGMIWQAQAATKSAGWRFAAAPNIEKIQSMGSYFTNEWIAPTLKLTEIDGREVNYTYDSASKSYVSEATGPEGVARVRILEGNCYERTFPGGSHKEMYDDKGRLRRREFPTGLYIEYQYDAKNEVRSILLPHERMIELKMISEQPLVRVLTLKDKAGTHVLARYTMDDHEQATTLTTEIPEPNGEMHTTTYTLVPTVSGEQLNIVASDKTQHTIDLKQDVIKKLQEGETARVWTFDLDLAQRQMRIQDAQQQTTLVGFDAQKSLANFKTPTDAVAKQFEIQSNGQLRKHSDTDGCTHTYSYEPITGQRATHTNSELGTVTCVYEKNINSPQFGLLLAVITQEGMQSATRWLVYNERRECCFEISPEGRITHHVYNDQGQCIATQRLTTQRFPTQKLKTSFNAAESYAVLKEWWGQLQAQDLALLEIQSVEYDDEGHEKKVTQYTHVNQQGIGIASEQNAVIERTHDMLGNVTQRIEATHYSAERTSVRTDQRYDGLSRTLSTVEAVASTDERQTQRAYVANIRVTVHANGLRSREVMDSGGLLVAQQRSTALAARDSRFKRDALGSVFYHLREDGQANYQQSDARGRLRYQLFPEGKVVHYDYDARDHVCCTTTYLLTPVSTSQESIDFAALLKDATPQDTRYTFYNGEDQCCFEVNVKIKTDGEGQVQREAYITQHVYSLQHRIKTIHHEKPIKITENQPLTYAAVSNFCVNDIAFATDVESYQSREIRYFRDLDGLIIGEQVLIQDVPTPVGYLTQYERDGAGRIIREIVYLKLIPMLTTLTTSAVADIPTMVTQFRYDNAGRKIARLDADGYLTTYDYYANGKLKRECEFAKRVAAEPCELATLTLPTPDVNQDKIIRYDYDDLGRETLCENSQTQLKITHRYDVDDHSIMITLTDLRTGAERQIQKAYDAFGALTHEANERLSAKYAHNRERWMHHEYHPRTGLRLSSMNAIGHITRYYYDAARRPVLEINADGAVVAYEYAALCDKPTRIHRYYERSKAMVAFIQDSSNDGFISDKVRQALPPPHVKDRITTHTYDEDGLVSKTRTATQALKQYERNRYGELLKTQEQITADQTLTTTYVRDQRGNCIRTQQSGANINVTTQQAFEDVLNRQTMIIDASGLRINQHYPDLRTVVRSVQDDPEQCQTEVRDAFMRLASTTDWHNHLHQQHQYHDATRTETITSAEARVRRKTRNAFAEIEKVDEHGRETQQVLGVDGQVEKIIHPDGSHEERAYDLSGQLNSVIAPNSKKTTFKRNAAGDVTAIIETVAQQSRTTKCTPNVFGENEKSVAADGYTQCHDVSQHGLVAKTMTDPEKLQLVTETTCNHLGGVLAVRQGDTHDKQLYVERITRDGMNRELARCVRMSDTEELLLAQHSYDAAGHVLTSTDGNGHLMRRVYDKRGNCRFEIDAKGFVVEKQYDHHQQEIMQRCYAKALTPTQLAQITADTTPAAMTAFLQASADDALRYRCYDRDQLLRYELHGFAPGTSQAGMYLTEWQRDTHGQCTAQCQYASPITAAKQGIDLTHAPNTTTITALIRTSSLAADPKNRVTQFARDVNGRIRFTRDAEGYVTEKRRDVNGKVVALIKYAAKYTALDFKQPVDKLAQQLDQTDADNRLTHFVYDGHGRLRYQIDAEGYLCAFHYNEADLATGTSHYYHSLFTKLSLNARTKLMTACAAAGTARDSEQLLYLCEGAVKKIADEAHDVHEQKAYDSARRLESMIDGEGYTETLTLNALGLTTKRTDKCQQTWEYYYDLAKRLKKEMSPVVTLSEVQRDAQQGVLRVKTNTQQVALDYAYDGASDITQVIFGANTAEKRVVEKRYDANRKPTGNLVREVWVDDGSDTLPTEVSRPEVKKDIGETIISDYAGRPIVTQDPAGALHFSVYDALGRECFVIDGEGYVTAFEYDDGFNAPTRLRQYANSLSSLLLKSHASTGFTFNEMTQYTNALKDPHDRTMHFDYDRRGLKRMMVKDAVVCAEVVGDELKLVLTVPQSTWSHNAFAEVIRQQDRLNSTQAMATQHVVHDRNGNPILTVSPNGYVTEQCFGMAHPDPERHDYLCLEKIEYAQPIAQQDEMTGTLIRAALAKREVHEGDVDADRHDIYAYDRRGLLVQTQNISGDDLFDTLIDAIAKPQISPQSRTIVTGTSYDGERRVVAYRNADGEKRYLIRDARGDVIYETDFPLVIDVENQDVNHLPKKEITLTQHLINAHQQKVGAVLYANAPTQPINENTRLADVQVRAHADDQQSLSLMDQRGCPIIVQTPTGVQYHTTFNAMKKPVRRYHWVSGYQQKNAELTKVRHLHCERNSFDQREHLIMYASGDEHGETQTHKHLNAFGECEGLGPDAEHMVVNNRYDHQGYRWYSNEEGGIPTISFPNARGEQVARFRSPQQDLSVFANATEAAKVLLATPYAQMFQHMQRHVYVRDAEGNVVTEQTPWYRSQPKDAPTYVQMSFVVQQVPQKGWAITWQLTDELLQYTPIFYLRVKGTNTWLTPEVSAMMDAHTWGVNINEFSSDLYEYRLDFRYNDHDKALKDPEHIPVTYRAEGETMLTTGVTATSQNLLWYMRDDKTLVLCGKLEDISGVELWRDGQALKRLAGERNAAGELVVDLNDEVDGTYAFKAVYGMSLGETLKVGEQKGAYGLHYYQPVYRFGDLNTVKADPNTLPPDLTLDAMHFGAIAPVPSMTTTFNCHEKDCSHETLAVGAAETAPGALLSALDAQHKRYFLDTVVPSIREWQNGPWRYENYHRLPLDLNPCMGRAFYHLTHTSTQPVHGVWMNNNLQPVHDFMNQSYRIFSNTTTHDKPIDATLVSLSACAVSPLLGQITVHGSQPGAVLSPRLLSLQQLEIENYTIAALHRDHVLANTARSYYHYVWQTNLSKDYLFQVKHNEQPDYIQPTDLSALPTTSTHGKTYPQSFQWVYPRAAEGPSPSTIAAQLYIDEGHMVPMAKMLQPVVTSLPYATYDVTVAHLHLHHERLQFFATPKDVAKYPDVYTLYFRPLPVNFPQVCVAVALKNTLTQPAWHLVPTTQTAHGVAANISALLPGDYLYQFTDAEGKVLDLSPLGLNTDAQGAHGSYFFSKDMPGHRVFVSKAKDHAVVVKKPRVTADYDRWHQQTRVSDRRGHDTHHAFNRFNQLRQVTTPVVTVVDAQGQTTTMALTTHYLHNRRGQRVAEIKPNGAMKRRFINHHGDTLREMDADGVHRTTVLDRLRRKLKQYGMRGDRLTFQHSRENGCRGETITHSDGRQEIRVFNEDSLLLMEQDTLRRASYYDHDKQHREIASFKPRMLDLKPVCLTREQKFHERSDQQIYAKDEDGHVQTWSCVNDKDPVTDFLGLVQSHTNMSGELTLYTHNFNRQVLTEKSYVGGDTSSAPQRNIAYGFDDAGRQALIEDHGVHLTTTKQHDEDDYCEALHFRNAQGAIAQATLTDYDALHRIHSVSDTRISLLFGYDLNSNRRFAHAVMLDDTQHIGFHEAWYDHTLADRPLIRNGVFDQAKKQITIAPQQGTQLLYDAGEVARVSAYHSNTHLLHNNLKYDSVGRLHAISTEALDSHVVQQVLRQWDEGDRCTSIEKTRGLIILYRTAPPEPEEYLHYHLPTYVLVLNPPMPYRLFYYEEGVAQEIYHLKHSYPELYDYLNDEKLTCFDAYFPETNDDLHKFIWRYDRKQHAGAVADKMQYTEVDSVSLQTRLEDNAYIHKYNQRQTTRATRSGLALEEVNYYEQTYKADDKKDNTSFAIRDRYCNTYSNRNDVKLHAVEGERVESRGDVSHDYKVPVNTRTVEDVNGEVTDIESNQPSESRHALINSEHCVVFKNTSKGRNYYFYAEKQPGKIVLMAYFGDFPETLRYQIKHGLQRDAYVPPVVNVDVNHHAPSASYPPAVPSHYTVPQAMTYQQIAEELNYTGYADAIAHANGRMADDVVPAHATIRIPTLYFAIPETAWNGTALTVDQLMSLVYPTLPMPGVKFKKHHINYWALGLEAVAAAAIMALVPGALEALGPMLAYTMAAAMASASTQVIAMGFGTQSGFEVKDFARDTALAAITGGLTPQLGTAEKISASIMLRNMLIAETIAMAQQAALVGSGVQKQVNYAVLGATALKSVVSTASSSVRNPIVNAMINDIADRVIDTAVLNQHVSPPVLAVQTAGSLVGSYLGTRTLDKLQGDRRLAVEVEMHTARAMPTQRTRMQYHPLPQKIERERAVRLSATEDEVQQTGLDIDDVTFNVPDPVLPLGDATYRNPAIYALGERMQHGGFSAGFFGAVKDDVNALRWAATHRDDVFQAMNDNINSQGNLRKMQERSDREWQETRQFAAEVYHDTLNGDFRALGEATEKFVMNTLPGGKIFSLAKGSAVASKLAFFARTAKIAEEGVVLEKQGAESVVVKETNVFGVKSIEEMALELRDELGQNSVNFRTSDKSGHIDLAGRSHYDKAAKVEVPTPHVQMYNIHAGPNGRISLSRKSETIRPATKADIRIARRLAEQQGLILRNQQVINKEIENTFGRLGL